MNGFTTRPELRGSFGMVASTHWQATAVGMGVLERGGNAFDAAVATGFALQVVEPHLNGPGGEVPILGHLAGADRPFALCGQGIAPAAATPQHFADIGLDMIPGTGHLPAVVPGSFDAWMLLLRDHGTISLRAALEPAIDLAAGGFPLVDRAAGSIHAIAEHFRTHWPSSAAVWLPQDRVPQPGHTFRWPALAATWKRLLSDAEAAGPDRDTQIEAARRVWSQGFVAELIDDFMRQPLATVDGRRDAGLLTGDDMATWQAQYEATVSTSYAGVEVHKTDTWGQGPALLMLLRLLDRVGLSRMDPLGPDWVHQIVEGLKLVLADRDTWFADPLHEDVPLSDLLSDAYADARAGQITATASFDLRPGAPGGRDPSGARAALLERAGKGVGGLGAGEPTFADLPEVEGDTVHIDIIDRHGNLVSATPSGGWLQSSPVVPGLGFSLSTRGQMFWLDDRLPGRLRPGRRPRTTLSPSLITRDGAGWLGIGTPGGDQQDQWIAATLLRLLHTKAGLQATIDAPLFHTAHYVASFSPRAFAPGQVLIEDRFPEATIAELRRRGHDITVMPSWSIGRVCAAGRGREGQFRAAATPRLGQAYAAGR